jgi:hypothetical protein
VLGGQGDRLTIASTRSQRRMLEIRTNTELASVAHAALPIRPATVELFCITGTAQRLRRGMVWNQFQITRQIQRRGEDMKRAIMGLLSLRFLRRRHDRTGRRSHK